MPARPARETQAGANSIVAASSIYKAVDKKATILALRSSVEKYGHGKH